VATTAPKIGAMSAIDGSTRQHLSELDNGVRVLSIVLPHAHTATVSVFVRTGSAHERRSHNGISHVVEHMAFKGTQQRDARRINLDAERLGAEVNAHTDKDHTAFHMRGMAGDALAFVRMLGEIVCQPTFPQDEWEREREVLLQEFGDDEDDALATAFKLFDNACFGNHPAAQPVIGLRRNVERFTRADLVAHVQGQFTGANVIVAAAGPIDPEAVLHQAQAAFGALPRGLPNTLEAPAYRGDIRARRIAGGAQVHLVLGFPLPPLAADDAAGEVAAALFGEGMSSPLMHSLRERLGLVYYAACSADVLAVCGQFVVEASMSADKLEPVLHEVAGLLAAQTRAIDTVDLERARKQLAVRRLRTLERPMRRLEDSALELFVHGRLRDAAERMAAVDAVNARRLRETFEAMLAAGVSAAVTGAVARGASERTRETLSRGLAVR
jgi:predicted Zn-dependent peptidase